MEGGEGCRKWCCPPLSLHVHLLLPAWEEDNRHSQSHGELSHQQAIPLAVVSPILLAAEGDYRDHANSKGKCHQLQPSLSATVYLPAFQCLPQTALPPAMPLRMCVCVCVCASVCAQVSASCTVLVILRVCSYQCMWLLG